MYRLLFASEYLHVLGSRRYVSGLWIGAWAVAILGLRSHRGLISGQAVIAIWALRLWGRIFSVPCLSRSRTPLDQDRVSDTGQDLISLGVEWRPMSQYAPRDAGKLVGQSNGQLVSMHACSSPRQPVAKAEAGPVMGPHQHDICGLNKQHAQVSASAL